jgi:hypothetical protein
MNGSWAKGVTGGLSKYEDPKLWSIKGYVMRMSFDRLKEKINECGDDLATRLDNDMGKMRFILTVTYVKAYWKARADEKQLASHDNDIDVDLTVGGSDDDSGDDLVSGPEKKPENVLLLNSTEQKRNPIEDPASPAVRRKPNPPRSSAKRVNYASSSDDDDFQ